MAGFSLGGVLMAVMGLITFISSSKHLLSTLLALEMMALGLFWVMSITLSLKKESFIMMIFLTLLVCEGSLGLSLLVFIARSYGSDYFSSINLLQW